MIGGGAGFSAYTMTNALDRSVVNVQVYRRGCVTHRSEKADHLTAAMRPVIHYVKRSARPVVPRDFPGSRHTQAEPRPRRR